jgi:hypothetical protein
MMHLVSDNGPSNLRRRRRRRRRQGQSWPIIRDYTFRISREKSLDPVRVIVITRDAIGDNDSGAGQKAISQSINQKATEKKETEKEKRAPRPATELLFGNM